MSDDTTLTADIVAELVAALDDRDVDPDTGPPYPARRDRNRTLTTPQTTRPPVSRTRRRRTS